VNELEDGVKLLPDGLIHSDGDAKDVTVERPRGRFLGRRQRGVLLFAGVAAVTLAAAACGSSSKTSSGSATTSPPSTVTPAASRAPATSSPASATTVSVALTEFHIALSQMSLSPGSYTFQVANQGKIVHAFEITGPGVSGAKTGDLQPGQSGTV